MFAIILLIMVVVLVIFAAAGRLEKYLLLELSRPRPAAKPATARRPPHGQQLMCWSTVTRSGARLRKVAKEKGMLLMGCDQCCYEREIADKLLPGVPIGCFPDLYKALSGNMPDQVITL